MKLGDYARVVYRRWDNVGGEWHKSDLSKCPIVKIESPLMFGRIYWVRFAPCEYAVHSPYANHRANEKDSVLTTLGKESLVKIGGGK